MIEKRRSEHSSSGGSRSRACSLLAFLAVIGLSCSGVAFARPDDQQGELVRPPPWHRLERRTDRGSLGAGNRVAAYVNGGIFYGSSELGPVLSTLGGTNLEWQPALVRYR